MSANFSRRFFVSSSAKRPTSPSGMHVRTARGHRRSCLFDPLQPFNEQPDVVVAVAVLPDILDDLRDG